MKGIVQITALGEIFKPAEIKRQDKSTSGWCKYILRIQRLNKGPNTGPYMFFLCKQWLNYNSQLVSLLTPETLVLVSGTLDCPSQRQTDGTYETFKIIEVSKLTILPQGKDNTSIVEKPIDEYEMSKTEIDKVCDF